jgi:hypothetical protein
MPLLPAPTATAKASVRTGALQRASPPHGADVVLHIDDLSIADHCFGSFFTCLAPTSEQRWAPPISAL